MASITSKGIDIERKEILQGYGKPPPEGLIPVGGSGIYLSPNVAKNKPVSPFDCEQWPDSPYCGGVPWTRTPIGFDLDFGFDGCGGWVEGTPIIGFTKMPKISAAFRLPGECRDQFQPKNVHNIPEEITENSLSKPPTFPSGIPADTRVIAVFVFDELEYSFNDKIGNWTEEQRMSVVSSFTKLSVPGDYTVGYPGTQPPLAQAVATAYSSSTKISKVKEIQNGNVLRDFSGGSSSEFILSIHPAHKQYKDSSNRTWDLRINNLFRSPTTGQTVTSEGPSTGSHIELVVGKYGDLVEYYSGRSFHSKYSYRDRDGDGADYVFVKNCRLAALHITEFKNEPKAPPPDYRKRKCDCMQCCGSGQAQDRRRDQDNAELLKILKEIRKAVGVDEFPAKVPETFLTSYDSSGKATPPKQIIIENIPQLQAWTATALEAPIGEMGAIVQIEDTDPTQEGNQSGKVIFKNISELLLDAYTLIFDSWMMAHQSIQLQTKELIQGAMIHRTNTQNNFAIAALIDFFGFKQKEIKKKIPFPISIGKETLETFIKESEEEITVIDFDPDDKNCRSYQDDMIEIRHMAAMYRAQNWRKLNASGELGGQVIELVKMGMGYIDKINQGKVDPRNPEGEVANDFDKFCEDAETQFSRITGINPDKPYGVPYSNRPKITKLSEGHTPDSNPS